MTTSRLDSSRSLNIAIIGRGKVGQSLTQLFKQLERSDANIESVSNIGRSKAEQMLAAAQADIVFLCVDDASIQPLCLALAPSFHEACIVSHCSGALDSSILSAAQQKGCYIASTHPLNTFPNLENSLSRFSSKDHGSYLYAEGDHEALETLLPLFNKAGFVSLGIDREAKPLYHAACVFACNYLVSLMDMSLESAAAAGLDQDQFWISLQPLIQATLSNISNKGITQSLSGPIARGDHRTVESHVHILGEKSDQLQHNYIDLGLHALEIAVKKNELNKEQLDSLRVILDKKPKSRN